MGDKGKTLIKKIENVMEGMDDEELEKLLLVGEGMVIMAGIKDKNAEKQEKEVV